MQPSQAFPLLLSCQVRVKHHHGERCTKRVARAPMFHYLAVCDAEDGHSRKCPLGTGGGCMHERTCVCASEGKTLYHLISFRNQILGGDMTIGEKGRDER